MSTTMLAYGGGVNSTALLLGLYERGEQVDVILFADTGGEKPQTYWYIWHFSRWLVDHGFPAITIVRKRSKYASLEDECLTTSGLPSKVFGWPRCSDKWKMEPQRYFLNRYPQALETWATGGLVTKLIGIDAGEAHRAHYDAEPKYVNRYPLIEWNWAREECVATIQRHGVTIPPKSACFFCPSSKKHEILALSRDEPGLFARAVAMEQRAKDAGNLDVVKGLGRNWSWDALVKSDLQQLRMFPEPPSISCVCFDGEGEDAA